MRLLKRVLIFLVFISLGALLGGFFSRLVSHSDMGWDRLANFIGGVFIGACLGLGLAIWRVALSNSRKRAQKL